MASVPPGSAPIQVALWLDGQQIQVVQFDPAKVASFSNAAERQELWGMTQEFRTKITCRRSLAGSFDSAPLRRLTRQLPGTESIKAAGAAVAGIQAASRSDAAGDRGTPKRAGKAPGGEDPGKQRANRIAGAGWPIRARLQGPSSESLKKIYACGHLDGHHTKGCARVIVERLAHRAYRRPVTPKEVTQLTSLIADVQRDGGTFEEGLATAIQAMLLSPHFLFRIERAPARPLTIASARSLSQHELASRLSYFLWSSMPDDALLAAADRGRLAQPAALVAQVRRMLLDPKSHALIENFGGQWLQVRKLESVKPDRKRFPEFDEYLRLSMRRETEMFFESIVRENRSILDFIDANYTYLNERLARFYNVPDVQGNEFRKVLFAA